MIIIPLTPQRTMERFLNSLQTNGQNKIEKQAHGSGHCLDK